MEFENITFFNLLLCHSNYKNFTRITHSYHKKITRTTTNTHSQDTMSLKKQDQVGRLICGNTDVTDPDGKYCFGLAYQKVFLDRIGASGLTITPQVVRSIDNGDIDWALGAAVTHACEHFSHTHDFITDPAFTSTIDNVPASWFLILLGIILVLLSVRRKKASNDKIFD